MPPPAASHAACSETANASCTLRTHRRYAGLTIVSQRFLQDRLVETEIGDELPELAILFA